MLYIHSLVPYLGYFNFGIHTGNSLLLYSGMIHIIPCNGLVARNCIEPPPGHCFLSHQRRDEQTEKEVSALKEVFTKYLNLYLWLHPTSTIRIVIIFQIKAIFRNEHFLLSLPAYKSGHNFGLGVSTVPARRDDYRFGSGITIFLYPIFLAFFLLRPCHGIYI